MMKNIFIILTLLLTLALNSGLTQEGQTNPPPKTTMTNIKEIVRSVVLTIRNFSFYPSSIDLPAFLITKIPPQPLPPGLEPPNIDTEPLGPEYEIKSISPTDACPGQEITIKGEKFGVGGSVVFNAEKRSLNAEEHSLIIQYPYSTEEVIVKAESWSDNEIKVIVPANAKRGQKLGLKIGNGYPRGKDLTFQGGELDISLLEISELGNNYIVEPGSDVTVRWKVLGTESINIKIKIDEEILSEENYHKEGNFTLSIPSFDGPAHLQIIATAANTNLFCSKVKVISNYEINSFYHLEGASIQTKPMKVTDETNNGTLYALNDEILTFDIKSNYLDNWLNPSYYVEYRKNPHEEWSLLKKSEYDIDKISSFGGHSSYRARIELNNFNEQTYFRVFARKNSHPDYLRISRNEQKVIVKESPEILTIMLHGGSLITDSSAGCKSACNCQSYLKNLAERLLERGIANKIEILSYIPCLEKNNDFEEITKGKIKYCERPQLNSTGLKHSIVLGRWDNTTQEDCRNPETPIIDNLLDEYQDENKIKYLILLGYSHGGAKIIDTLDKGWRWNNIEVSLLVLWDAADGDVGGESSIEGHLPKRILNFHQSFGMWWGRGSTFNPNIPINNPIENLWQPIKGADIVYENSVDSPDKDSINSHIEWIEIDKNRNSTTIHEHDLTGEKGHHKIPEVRWIQLETASTIEGVVRIIRDEHRSPISQ